MVSCSSLGFTKPLYLENQSFEQQPVDQETNVRSRESKASESNVTSVADKFLNGSSAHNRIARGAGHMCVLKSERTWDSSRGKFV